MGELMLDGNAIAGLLQEVFAVEMTTAIGTCGGCGAAAPVGGRSRLPSRRPRAPLPSGVPAVLRDATHGFIYTVADSSGVRYSSGRVVVTLD